MKTSAQYIDAIRERHGLNSDRKAALLLGVSQPSVVRFRKGEDAFGDETATRVAELLDLEPEEVMIAAHAERARDPRTRALWEGLLKKAGYAAGVVLLAGSVAGTPAPARAASASGSGPVCIMSTRRRRGFRPDPGRPLRAPRAEQTGFARFFFAQDFCRRAATPGL